jgi:hypothetical protein
MVREKEKRNEKKREKEKEREGECKEDEEVRVDDVIDAWTILLGFLSDVYN